MIYFLMGVIKCTKMGGEKMKKDKRKVSLDLEIRKLSEKLLKGQDTFNTRCSQMEDFY